MGKRVFIFLAAFFAVSNHAYSTNRYYRCENLWRSSHVNLTIGGSPVYGERVVLFRYGKACYLYAETSRGKQTRMMNLFVPVDAEGRAACSNMLGIKDSNLDHFLQAYLDEMLFAGNKGMRGRLYIDFRQGATMVRSRYLCEEQID